MSRDAEGIVQLVDRELGSALERIRTSAPDAAREAVASAFVGVLAARTVGLALSVGLSPDQVRQLVEGALEDAGQADSRLGGQDSQDGQDGQDAATRGALQ